jgi:hypothetical protein
MLLTTNRQRNLFFKNWYTATAVVFGLIIVATDTECDAMYNLLCKAMFMNAEAWLVWRLLSFLVTCN